ncbi:Os04g0434101 [Oryza sativa Japonica Group]|uniref:Os04g0434101 protein n=1 Tax=Oryza sativa subsp. japonica TaxID=39947 RepID=A0A0P0WAQ7_ORYSJ|nr:Os04g0434101 [Oryza sativa Japonica Group]
MGGCKIASPSQAEEERRQGRLASPHHLLTFAHTRFSRKKEDEEVDDVSRHSRSRGAAATASIAFLFPSSPSAAPSSSPVASSLDELPPTHQIPKTTSFGF